MLWQSCGGENAGECLANPEGCRVQHVANRLWIFPHSVFCIEDHSHFRRCSVSSDNREMGQIMQYWTIRLIQRVYFFDDPMFLLVLDYPVIGIQNIWIMLL